MGDEFRQIIQNIENRTGHRFSAWRTPTLLENEVDFKCTDLTPDFVLAYELWMILNMLPSILLEISFCYNSINSQRLFL